MELTKNVAEKVMRAERYYRRLKQVFAGFVERASFIEDAQCSVKGIKLTTSPAGDSLEVSVAGIHVRFVFLLCYESDGTPRGKIICTREVPVISDNKDILGSFTFSGQGITDFEVNDGGDQIEMEYHALEIVMHFVDFAIAKPLP